ncbi:lysozyme inhibitor LprI family protein [Pseudomonas sp. SG20056]|uniref:lysozyme inhibitor LprI family protein n=1 Tax=Pseudomonas sp. SG20056 TaxID=3074146 RepID=UPI00287F9B39|nr:lysozyme inhibitor LprI family protein [Pseudomonas sp. SG20056]WNF45187.1 lysozyme inhibitor LprI family protein [Pseudomonas sp. SG20056]
MTIGIRSVLAINLGLLATPVWADDCANAMDQLTLNQCAAAEYAAQDKRLNQLYGDYRKRLDDGQKQQLKDVQLAWIKFRDLACAFESASVEGGSAYPMVLNGCLTQKTAARVKELEQLAVCEEGDLSCPMPAQ